MLPALVVACLFWFNTYPVIRFADEAHATQGLVANLLVGSIVAVLLTLAVSTIGRAMRWWS